MAGSTYHAYVRVTLNEKLDKPEYLETQITSIKNYLKNLGVENFMIWTEYTKQDFANHGLNKDRRLTLRTLLDKMNKGDHLVVYKIDRIAKRIKQHLAVTEFLERRKCTLHEVRMGVNTTKASERFIISALAMLEEYNKNIMEETNQEKETKLVISENRWNELKNFMTPEEFSALEKNVRKDSN